MFWESTPVCFLSHQNLSSQPQGQPAELDFPKGTQIEMRFPHCFKSVSASHI